jgi:CheY-like chemotaxis protein
MKVLLVEDEPSLREGMADLVIDLAEVRATGTVAEALVALRSERFSLVMTDLRIAGSERGGRDILEVARRGLQPVIIVSAASADEVAHTLRPFEPDAVLAKPFQLEDLLGVVERFLGLRSEVERRGRARALPASGWREVAPGVELAPEAEGPCAWVRMRPGASFAWQVHQGREGVFVVEGDLEVDGEPRGGPQYLYLASGPHAAHSREGCLAVSLALRA